jgi:hypothetical protein
MITLPRDQQTDWLQIESAGADAGLGDISHYQERMETCSNGA